MRTEEFQQRQLEVGGWPVRLTSFRLGETYHCTADNVSPGARLCRTEGVTREEAEEKAVQRSEKLLARTRRMTAGQ